MTHEVDCPRGAEDCLYRAFFESVQTAAFLATVDRRMLDCNREFMDLLGFETRASALAIDVAALCASDDDRTQFVAALAESQGVSEVPLRLRRPDGEERSVLVSATARRDSAGNVREWIVSLVDVTERHRIDSRLERLEQLDAVGRLAGSIAHDFNNTLTAVQGLAELIRRRASDPETVMRHTATLLDTVRHGAALTGQLLSFSRRHVEQLEIVDVCAAVRRLNSPMQRMVGERVRVRLAVPAGPLCIRIDRSQLEQIVLNLVVNARDAMPDGGEVRLEVRAEDVAENESLDLPAGSYVVVAIDDDGVGMDEETRLRVFEPFFTTKSGGTGLGLATVGAIVSRRGGSIGCTTSPGVGTSVVIHFPRSAARGAVAADAVEPVATGALRVLVVEDESAVRDVVRLALEERGHAVVCASSAEEARARVHVGDAAGPAPFDVLVSDLVLPGHSGRQLADQLVAHWPSLRVVLMSGYSELEAGAAAKAHRETVFLHKPFSAAELLGAVEAARRLSRDSA